MIISQRRQFIFAAIPKTGTHAVRRALRAHLGPDDMEQVGLFVQKRFPIAPLAAIGHGHISLAQVRPFMTPEAFQAYLKFAFVRNPFDRFVSYCAFVTREENAFQSDPRDVMRHFLFRDRPDDHLLFQPQHLFVCDAQGRLLADEIGHVEDMQASYDRICARIGIASTTLERVNESVHADYRQYYDRDIAAAVAEYYRKDFELFGYPIEDPA